MKITFNRKMIFMVSCLILVACAGNGKAVAQIERPQEFIKDIDLYETCKADLEKENFDLGSGPINFRIHGAVEM